MAEIVNLNRARKARARVQKEETAAQNRILFGRTKAEKQLDAARKAAEAKNLDGHKRED